MHIHKRGSQWRGSAAAGALSEVRGDTVLIFLMTALDEGLAYSGGGGGSVEKDSWHKLRGSKMNRGQMIIIQSLRHLLLYAKILYFYYVLSTYMFFCWVFVHASLLQNQRKT